MIDECYIGDCTAHVAQRLGRRWIGMELNPVYVKLQGDRTRQYAMELV